MKILCFGDSNTYGYDPRSYFGGQYPTQHRWVDLLLVMLGGNDLLQGNSVEAVSQRMEAFLARIPLEKSQIVLIGPPRMKPGAWITDDRLLEDCVRLNAAYRTVAEKLSVRFIDATDWDIEVTFDGVHYSEKGHQTFAEQLFLSLNCSLEVKP